MFQQWRTMDWWIDQSIKWRIVGKNRWSGACTLTSRHLQRYSEACQLKLRWVCSCGVCQWWTEYKELVQHNVLDDNGVWGEQVPSWEKRSGVTEDNRPNWRSKTRPVYRKGQSSLLDKAKVFPYLLKVLNMQSQSMVESAAQELVTQRNWANRKTTIFRFAPTGSRQINSYPTQ